MPRVDLGSYPLGSMPLTTALAGLPLAESPLATVSPSEEAPPAVMSLLNLLPLASPTLRLPTAGAYVGDGMPPVPAKLAAKIRRWEFVEMGELLPEFWVAPRDGEGDNKVRRARQGRKVADLCTWLQCYAVYMAVLGPQEPQVIPDLMACMGLVIRVSKDHEGLGWVRYDSAFRRQAALSGNKRWSVLIPTLFLMNFTARSSAVKRCELCFATTHSERECAQNGDRDPGVGDRLRNLEAAVLAIARPAIPRSMGSDVPRPSRPSGEACRKWNMTGCTYPKCRHLHVCSTCRGGHTASRCNVRGPGPLSPNNRLPGRPY